jgi:glutamate carboxypeptidase
MSAAMDIDRLLNWVGINSGTLNPEGLRRMADALEERLRDLPGILDRLPLPAAPDLDGQPFQPGEIIRLSVNPKAPVQILLSGHMDTVHGPNSPFRKAEPLSADRVRGPGITDMKGGLFIMIEALETFLNKDHSGNLGGRILITADEEVGSPGSRELILEAGRTHHLGLVFESALPGGELVSERKGAGVFRIRARGRSAHSGRDFEKGRNAVVALSDLAIGCHRLNGQFPGSIVNVAGLTGGGPANVVPDAAAATINIRIQTHEQAGPLESALRELVEAAGRNWDGVSFTLSGGFTRPPKEESGADALLHRTWNAVERELGLPLSGKRATGGGSDGNLLASVGLPILDGVGIKGDHIHSTSEYAILSSIPQQVARTVAFMERVASQPETFQSLRNP